jgi:hypothetical protein
MSPRRIPSRSRFKKVVTEAYHDVTTQEGSLSLFAAFGIETMAKSGKKKIKNLRRSPITCLLPRKRTTPD